MITSADITRQVTTVVEAAGPDLAQGIDIDGVVRDIVATHGLIDINDLGDEFWQIVALHDATQADAPAVDLGSTERAEWLTDMPQLRANGHSLTARGSSVELTDDALAVLADIDEESDGHYDGSAIWIGGTGYAVTRP